MYTANSCRNSKTRIVFLLCLRQMLQIQQVTINLLNLMLSFLIFQVSFKSPITIYEIYIWYYYYIVKISYLIISEKRVNVPFLTFACSARYVQLTLYTQTHSAQSLALYCIYTIDQCKLSAVCLPILSIFVKKNWGYTLTKSILNLMKSATQDLALLKTEASNDFKCFQLSVLFQSMTHFFINGHPVL